MRWCITLAAVLCFGSTAHAQVVVNASAGASTLYAGDGAELKTYFGQTGTTEVDVGGGIVDGHTALGISSTTQWDGWRFDLGDQIENFDLPTDLYGPAFFARGLSAVHHRDCQVTPSQAPPTGAVTRLLSGCGSTLRVFVGEDAAETQLPFMFGAHNGQPLGLVFYEQPLGRWTFSSYEVGASKVTSIQGLSFSVNNHLALAGSGGVGAGAPFGAGSARVTLRQLDAFLGYTASSPNFHRVILSEETLIPEARGLDAQTDFHPWSWVHLSLVRQGLAAQTTDNASIPVTLTGEGLSLRAGPADFSANHFSSTSNMRNTSGQDVGGGLDLFDGFLGIHDTEFWSPGLAPMNFGTVDERITQRFHLLESFSRQSNSDVSVGASYNSNALSVSGGYQVAYFPLLQNPWQKVLQLTVSVNIREAHATVATVATPNGGIRWGIFGNDFLTRDGDPESGYAPINRYVISGLAVDSRERPLSGVALKIGKQIVFSDDSGAWSVRVRKNRPQKIELVLSESLISGDWVVVSVPATASPGDDVKIVMQRATNLGQNAGGH